MAEERSPDRSSGVGSRGSTASAALAMLGSVQFLDLNDAVEPSRGHVSAQQAQILADVVVGIDDRIERALKPGADFPERPAVVRT